MIHQRNIAITWDPDMPPSKDEAPCCDLRRDHLGRLPIGYCSPQCVRRPDPAPCDVCGGGCWLHEQVAL